MVYHEITAGWSSCLIGRGAARDGGSIAAPPPRIEFGRNIYDPLRRGSNVVPIRV